MINFVNMVLYKGLSMWYYYYKYSE